MHEGSMKPTRELKTRYKVDNFDNDEFKYLLIGDIL